MAQPWENDAIKNAGKKWQDANKRGDQAGMNAAAEEAKRLRGESGYGLDGGQSNSRPTITDDSKWYGNGTNKVYQKKNGLGGSPGVDTNRNDQLQRNGNAYTGYGGNGSTSGKSNNDLISYQQQAYQDMLDQLEEQNRKAIEQGVNRLESNRGTINQGYDEAARQAYVAKLQSGKNLPQALAAQGLSGGASESANLALETSYGNNINTNEQARRNALTGLDQSIADLRSSGDLNLANQRLSLQQQQLSDYQNAYAQQLQQDNWQKQWDTQQSATEKQEAINLIQAHGDDYTAYINELQHDGDPSNDWLIPYAQMYKNEKVTGMEQAEAAAQQQAYENWLAEQKLMNDIAKTNYQINKPYYKTGSGGGGGGGSKTAAYNELVAAALDGNLPLDYVQQNRSAIIREHGLNKYNDLLKTTKQVQLQQSAPYIAMTTAQNLFNPLTGPLNLYRAK